MPKSGSIYRNDFNHPAEDQSECLHLSLAPPPFGHLGLFSDTNISICLSSWIRHQTKTEICLLEKTNLILPEVPERTTAAPPPVGGADQAVRHVWLRGTESVRAVSSRLAEASVSQNPLVLVLVQDRGGSYPTIGRDYRINSVLSQRQAESAENRMEAILVWADGGAEATCCSVHFISPLHECIHSIQPENSQKNSQNYTTAAEVDLQNRNRQEVTSPAALAPQSSLFSDACASCMLTQLCVVSLQLACC